MYGRCLRCDKPSTIKVYYKGEDMTKKRFVYDDFDDVIKDTYTQKEYNYHIGELELIVEEINNLHEKNEQLKSEIEKITKYKEHWAFISDCSIQVMNEEEKFKEDYLRIATNDLKEIQEENEQLKRKALDMEMDRDYYRTKSASLEEGYLQLQRENEKLRKENQALKDANDGLTGTIAHYMDEEVLE